MKLLSISILFCYLFLSVSLASITQAGRYLIVENTAVEAQVDLLAQTREVRFPDDIVTIGQAIEYLLLHTGYMLNEKGTWEAYQKILIEQPLPLVHRSIEPINLRDALRLLAGQAYQLIEDPLYRTVAFEVLPQYQIN